MKTPKLTKAQRDALSGAWTYEQGVDIAKQVRENLREAWAYMVPEVREALIAQRVFSVVRSRHSEVVAVRDMDLLLHAALVASGLRTVEEVVP